MVTGSAQCASPRVEASKITDVGTPCQEYEGYIGAEGYGIVQLVLHGKRLWLRAHRLAFAIGHGVDPVGKCVCHRCDNPTCVNPEHLFLGTDADNAMDRVARGRGSRGHNHHSSKLKPEDVAAIRSSRLSQGKLGKVYGVSGSAVGYIKRGVTYK